MPPKSASVVESRYEKGVWFVEGQQWSLPPHYRLLSKLGAGSFSQVCLAEDARTCTRVALKRIGNALATTDTARRVILEVRLLARVAHPGVVRLRDAFLRPASTGACHAVGGRLVADSLDLYLATEYMEGGDLFSLQGQLSAGEVRDLMWQLLQAIAYLHRNDIWHRDIKSANCLLTRSAGGRLVVKLCDLGSARHARPRGYGEKPPAGAEAAPVILVREDPCPSMDTDTDDAPTHTHASCTHACPPQSPLTRVVATPCYRAPEVVMSRGGYSSAVDMWSLGCIFAELLQRIPQPGARPVPRLHVPPLFALYGMMGMPKTPTEGDAYEGGVGSETTRRELQALFDVIGTPPWACIEAVSDPQWRSYLRNLRGRAPKLFSRFGFAGEQAVDLLARLLAFDPSRRCSAEEAECHEYFEDMQRRPSRSLGLATVPEGAATSAPEELAGRMGGIGLNEAGGECLSAERGAKRPRRSLEESGGGGEGEGGGGGNSGGTNGSGTGSGSGNGSGSTLAVSLRVLEEEVEAAMEAQHEEGRRAALRALLEREVAGVARDAGRYALGADGAWDGAWEGAGLLAGEGEEGDASAGDARLGLGVGLEVDARAEGPVSRDALAAGAMHAAGMRGAEDFLDARRHGEWPEETGGGGGMGAWGVACMPPGAAAGTGEAVRGSLRRAVQAQQGR